MDSPLDNDSPLDDDWLRDDDAQHQLPRVVSDVAPPRALLSNHHRIRALSQAWGEQRSRDRRLGAAAKPGGSSSDTDSDPGMGSPAAAPGRWKGATVTETPVPLPEFPRLPAHRSPRPPPAPAAAPGAAAPACADPPAAAPPAAPPSSSSSHRAEPPKDPAALRASALRFTEASALEFLEKARASSSASGSVSGSASGSASDSGRMHFATGGELLARTLQSAHGTTAARHHGTASPAVPAPLVTSALVTSDDTSDGDDIAMPRPPPKAPAGHKQEQSLLSTQDQCPYNMLQQPDGHLQGGRGTLFPTNYELLPEDPRYICLVRDCQRLCDSLKSLGGHFSAKHCENRLNDNLDGTFSVVDRYKNASGGSPAMVVSRRPLPSNAPPPGEPTLSFSLKRKLDNGTPASAAGSSAPTPRQDASAAIPMARPDKPVRSDGAMSDVCSYLDMVLGRKQRTPLRGDVDYLKELPRLRPLPHAFTQCHHDKLLSGKQYACALAYLVGDEVTGPKACGQRHATSRLSEKCIALPASMPGKLKRHFYRALTCMGCFYRSNLQRQRNDCDWVSQGAYESSSEGSDGDGEGPAAAGKVEAAELAPALPTSTRERHKRSRADADADADAGDGPVHKAARVGEGSSAVRRKDESLQVEVWEAAPGRQTNGSGENIGFSGRYMTGAQPIEVLQDVFMNTVPIGPGASNRWPADPDKARLFTVLSGKVAVKIDDSLTLGLHGVWKVMPGQTCQAQNRYYVPAEIQCVTIEF